MISQCAWIRLGVSLSTQRLLFSKGHFLGEPSVEMRKEKKQGKKENGKGEKKKRKEKKKEKKKEKIRKKEKRKKKTPHDENEEKLHSESKEDVSTNPWPEASYLDQDPSSFSKDFENQE